jgi:hypothetical protein
MPQQQEQQRGRRLWCTTFGVSQLFTDSGNGPDYDQSTTLSNCIYAYSPGRMFADGCFANTDATLGHSESISPFETTTGNN